MAMMSLWCPRVLLSPLKLPQLLILVKCLQLNKLNYRNFSTHRLNSAVRRLTPIAWLWVCLASLRSCQELRSMRWVLDFPVYQPLKEYRIVRQRPLLQPQPQMLLLVLVSLDQVNWPRMNPRITYQAPLLWSVIAGDSSLRAIEESFSRHCSQWVVVLLTMTKNKMKVVMMRIWNQRSQLKHRPN